MVHDAFKGLVQRQREGLDVEEVSTGEVFLGAEAMSKGLVDRLATSDEARRREHFKAIFHDIHT